MLLDWIPKHPQYLAKLYENEEGPNGDTEMCSKCVLEKAAWRCLSCFGFPRYCAECCRVIHEHHPFDRVERWVEPGYWKPAWLHEVGVELHVGHHGKACPSAGLWETESSFSDAEEDDWEDGDAVLDDMEVDEGNVADLLQRAEAASRHGTSNPGRPSTNGRASGPAASGRTSTPEPIRFAENHGRSSGNPLNGKNTHPAAPLAQPGRPGHVMTIVDTSGVHSIRVQTCSCPNAEEHDMQMLQCGLFPASHRRIQTCFTFNVLDNFNLANLECHTSAFNFYRLLKRRTNYTFPHHVPVNTMLFTVMHILIWEVTGSIPGVPTRCPAVVFLTALHAVWVWVALPEYAREW